MNPKVFARIEAKTNVRCVAVATGVVRRIEQLAPVDPLHHLHQTGPHLKDSYFVTPEEDGATIRSRQDYWAYVEFGTGQTPTQPHVRPALDEAKARA